MSVAAYATLDPMTTKRLLIATALVLVGMAIAALGLASLFGDDEIVVSSVVAH